MTADTRSGVTDSKARSIYDLATVAADYSPWQGTPRRTIIICSHMRSGSTLLSEALYFAGGLGCPIEYFHSGFRPSLERIWNVDDNAAYLPELYRRRTDATGTLGVKLFWPDALDVCERRFPDQADLLGVDLSLDGEAARRVYALVGAALAEICPNPTYVWLNRQDRLRGAVSLLIASQTQVWRRIPNVNDNVPVREPEYDYDKISRLYGVAAYCAARWEGLFNSLGVAPLRLTYEELVGSYEATVRGLVAALGASDTERVQSPRMRRQASAVSERFVARFLRDHDERVVRRGDVEGQ